MSIATEMNYKNKEEAITGILKKYLVIKDNMLLSERLFVAKSVINWIFQNSKNPLIIKSHLEDVERHINGELELSWKDGFIVRKKNKKETANENKKTEPKEKK